MGDIMNILIVSIRSLLFYIIITIVYRIMGKREMGQLSVMDFIVSIFIAELAAISIENHNDSILISIVPIIILVILQIITSMISVKSQKLRNILDGEPSVIINRGIINFKEMLKQRYNLDDLLSQLRDRSIKSIEEVDYAILESNGNLSVFTKDKDHSSTYPLPIIIDGKIQEDVLVQINKSERWLEKELQKEGYIKEDIFYGFYKNNELFLIKNQK